MYRPYPPAVPRNHYKLKNRYCFNSNLSEKAFLAILKSFCLGRSASLTAQLLSQSGAFRGRPPVSRVTIQNYFTALGHRQIFDYYDYSEKRRKPPSLKSFREIYWQSIVYPLYQVLVGAWDYDADRRNVRHYRGSLKPEYYGKLIPLMDRTLFADEMLPVLRDRFRNLYGFKKPNVFEAHYGYAFMIFTAKGSRLFLGKLPPSREYRQIQLKAFQDYIDKLKEGPLELTQARTRNDAPKFP